MIKKVYVITVGVAHKDGRILLLRRREGKRFDPLKWEFISGFIESGESVDEAVIREAFEETGCKVKKCLRKNIVQVSGKLYEWVIITYYLTLDRDDIKLDATEHNEYRWIHPEELNGFDCVIGLKEVLESVQ